MDDEPQSLRAIFTSAENKRKGLEASWETNTTAYQDKLKAAISQYQQCQQLTDSIAMFSSNESLEDVSTNDIQYVSCPHEVASLTLCRYLLLHYRIADLNLKINSSDRKATLTSAQEAFSAFLNTLDLYDILSPGDARLYEQYREAPITFSTASTSDPTARRDTKIRRFKEEKQLKQALEHFQRNPAAEQDDEVHRKLELAQIAYCTHQTFQSLESVAQELHILSMAPSEPIGRQQAPQKDERDRTRDGDGYSERLDAPHLSAGLKGPLLDKHGRPMRPFTLLGKREELQQGVFRPDHSLPTMSIDEYLEEEKRRGGIIEGGGPQSGMRPEPDEDDIDKADEETMKARAWDEFTEANPKGSGNTINRG